MKGIKIITLLLVLLVFAVLVYFIGFKLFFNSDRLTNKMKTFVSDTLKRDSDVYRLNLLPLGNFRAKDLRLASRDGFEAGTLGSIESLSGRLEILKILSREISIKDLEIDGFKINLGYNSLKDFKYDFLFSSIKNQIINNKGTFPVFKKARLDGFLIKNGEVRLKVKEKTVIFKNVFIKSYGSDDERFINGTMSFDMDKSNSKQHITLNFSYDRTNKIINIKDMKLRGLSFLAEGKIFLKEDGHIGTQYTIKVKQEDYSEILSYFIDKDPKQKLDTIPNTSQEITITYPKKR